MSTLPVLYPEGQHGPDRVTEMIMLKSSPSSQEVQSLISTLSNFSRQVLHALNLKDASTTVIIVDWLSDASRESAMKNKIYEKLVAKVVERTAFEYQGSLEKTPKAGWYSFSYMKTKKEKQPALTAMLDAYLRGIFYCGKFQPVFHHVAISKDDPEIMISFQGWPSKALGEEYWESKIHKDIFPAVADMTTVPVSWEAELK